MTPAEASAWRSLLDDASAPYKRAGRFAWHFARGKLRWDPVFAHLASTGLIAPRARVLDIGCGQGLLASLVQAAASAARAGRWPGAWAAAPSGARVTGIEMMPRDVARARQALGDSAEFVCADMRSAPFPAADVVVILDVLHYVPIAEQDAILARVRAALGSGGRLVLRVGDAAARGRFRSSQWVDRLVTYVRGHREQPRHGRSLVEWKGRLGELGFAVTSLPMHAGTPFANILLVGTVASLTVPATLDHAGIEARIPHRGRMCLLDRMSAWSPGGIECVATDHGDPAHPLRTRSGLLASAAVEYAAQAMALHGALSASAHGEEAMPGFLASARDVRLHAARLDDLAGDLVVTAERQAADAGRLLYAFAVRHEGRDIATGRIAVVLGAAEAALPA